MPALDKIEGIGEHNAEKLAQARIGSTGVLLKQCATRAGRRRVAKESGLTAAKLLGFVNRADLFRIHGVGEEYSDLLEAAGVDSVPELATRNADNLHAKLLKTNERKHLVRRPPALKMVDKWIRQAKKLNRVVEY